MALSPIDHTIAQEAIGLVTGDRQASYGHPYINFKETADLWSVVLGIDVTPEQVGLCMVLLKVARELHVPKRDNLVDAIGYLMTYDAVRHSTLNYSTCLCIEWPDDACRCDEDCPQC
jgi:hypothetical protein